MMNALLGGILIGSAVSIMLLFNGRITGISGIVSGILKPKKDDFLWRAVFLLGLIAGGFCLLSFYPQAFIQSSVALPGDYIFAGLLVGFGTLMGGGCTSGHGVCGISRLSIRSIVATIIFIVFGILSLLSFKILRGGV